METAKELKTLYVGQQPIKHYIILAKTFLKTEEQIKVVGRGKWIAKVVTITEILKRNGAKLSELKTGSVKMKNREGQDQFVSVISVTVTR
jgi:DNA-binding protein Alba